jgi:hypothetical protein
VLFGVVPLAVLVVAIGAAVAGNYLGNDFRMEFYPEAKSIVRGVNPYPAVGADLSGGVNEVFPVPAALLVSPLTLLRRSIATPFFCILVLVALALALRLLDVRDWRVYGAVALWPPTISAVFTANLSTVLLLLVALAWRFRGDRFRPGVAVGLAIALKLFLWPLVPLLLTWRRFASATVATGVAGVGFLMVLPFISLDHYTSLLRNMGRTFEPGSYNVVGLLIQARVGDRMTDQLLGFGVGALVLAVALSRRSLPLTVVASLLLSPIVWLHYLVLLVVPIALARPRFGGVWLLPLLLWAVPGNGLYVNETDITITLGVVALVAVLTARSARDRDRPPAKVTPLPDNAKAA